MEKSGSRRGRLVELRFYGPAQRMRRVIPGFHGRAADRRGGCRRTDGTGLCDQRKSGQRTEHAGLSLTAQLAGGSCASRILNQTTRGGAGADQTALDCAIQGPPRRVEAADTHGSGCGHADRDRACDRVAGPAGRALASDHRGPGRADHGRQLELPCESSRVDEP